MSTTSAPEQKAPLTLEEKAFNLEVAKFRFEQQKQGHFPIFPPNHPQNVMWAFAEGVLGAPYITEAARNDVNSIFFLLNTAHDLDVPWTFALRTIGLTPKGQVVIPGNLMLAILHKKGFKVKILQTSELVGEYEIERPDGSLKWSCPITYEQAKKSGWMNTNSGGIKEPWKDPANMLRWRSLAFTARVVAADALGGLIYIAEEMDDNGPIIDVDAEGDKKAEANPALTLQPKSLDSPASANVIEIPVKQPAKQPEPALSMQELRNEGFLKDQAAKAEAKPEPKPEPVRRTRKPAATPSPEPAKPVASPEQIKAMADANAAALGITDDDIPAANDAPEVVIPPTPPVVDEKAELAQRCAKINDSYGGNNRLIASFCAAYLGNKDELKDLAKFRSALEVLEKTLAVVAELPPSESTATFKIYLETPEQFARNVKVAVNPPTPEPEQSVEEEEINTPLDDVLPESWAGDTCLLAYNAMLARGLTKERFVGVLNNFGIRQLPEADAEAFFKMYHHAFDATTLLKLSMSKKYPMSLVLSDIVEKQELRGGKLSDKTPADAAQKAIMNALSEVAAMEGKNA